MMMKIKVEVMTTMMMINQEAMMRVEVVVEMMMTMMRVEVVVEMMTMTVMIKKKIVAMKMGKRKGKKRLSLMSFKSPKKMN